MRILTSTSVLTTIITIAFVNTKINAQEAVSTINQDPKFEKLLFERRKLNSTNITSDSYKIQIFNGSSDLAKKTLSEFRQEFKNIDGTIIFNTPNYKVLVGGFASRIEAERNLIEIQKKYKNTFLIKPTK